MAAALDFVGEAHGAADLDELRDFIPRALREIVPSDYVSYNELEGEGRVLAAITLPKIPDELMRAWERWAHQNPLVARFVRTRDGRAYRFSDVASELELRRLELFTEVYEPLGVRHQIAFALPSPPQLTFGIALTRGGRDYTERDRALLDLLRPHLIQAYRNVQSRSDPYLSAPPPRPRAELEEATLLGLGLTPREAELLALLARGADTEQAAARMRVSRRTVYKHTERIHAKLGTRDRAQAVATALAAERAARAAAEAWRTAPSARKLGSGT